MTACGGIIIVHRTRKKSSSLPQNRQRENAYAARIPVMSCPLVSNVVTTTEFRNQRPYGVRSNTSWYPSREKLVGRIYRNRFRISPEELNEIPTIQTNGISMASAPITVVIGGHTHTVIDPHTEPIEVDGVPIFQAGCNMEYVGDVEIDLSARTVRGRLVRLDRLDRRDEQPTPSGEHPRLHQATRNISDAVRTAVLEPVATITSARNANVATTLEDRLSGESAVANMITDALLFRYDRDLRDDRDGTVVVACDASGIQSGLTEENLESRLLRIDDLYRILPYADSIYRAVITPADLERIVRSNIARRIPPAALEPRGGDIGVMDWAKIARGYLHFSRNLRYGTGQSAIVAIDGIPLADLPQDYPITLYCNSFSAMGNQGWSVTDEDAFHEFGSVSLPELGFTDTAIPLRTALIEALRDIGAVTLERDGRHQVRA